MWVDDVPCVTVTRASRATPLDSNLRTEERFSPLFAWGFVGPSSRQLAAAILTDYFSGDPDGSERAGHFIEAFHLGVISQLPAVWALKGEDIGHFLRAGSLL
jgi:hypothetical protein